ncbi:TVP38/TMEM64 family protein [Prosthecobacter dejongeii]|uniref:TVP38/TMEM64 family membrane protein n=1 Tax=Prosthecobacter dejongeii TaxID=48465 RepID=A0A7W7YIU7_9BACT|nr:VTT domain-containing protein [Prosthecobacter dejongeii]MBB5036852.1 putative membrane protein YdjX (TVP38/TMEM64 family) [Prosthecobacter dejongeii]
MNGTDPDHAAPTPASPLSANVEITDQARLEDETTRSMGRENRRMLILVGIIAFFLLVAHFTPLKAWLTNIQAWKDFVDELGWIGHLSFILACAGGVMIGLPRLPLCAGAGLIFGFVEGLGLSLAGSVMGSYGAFLMTRAGARRAVLARAEKWPWLRQMLEKPSWLKVFWVRQMMLPGLVLNVLLGVTEVAHATFLFGTLAGYLPLNVAFTLVGSGLGKGSLAHSLTQLLGALAVVNVVGWLVWRLARKRQA